MAQTTEVNIDEFPVNLDLPAITAGADYQFTIQMLDDNEDPQPTTGWTMEIKGRSGDKNGDVLFDLTIGSGITHTAASGKFDIKIANSVTAALTVPFVAWDCKVTDASSIVTFPFEGLWQVNQPATR